MPERDLFSDLADGLPALADPDDPFSFSSNHAGGQKEIGFRRNAISIESAAFDLIEHGDPEKTGLVRGKPARKHPADHNKRTQDYYQSRGALYTRCEWWVVDGSGKHFKKDLLGLFDGLALRAGIVTGVQICPYEMMSTRLREMCSDRPVPGRGLGTKLANLLAWLDHYGKVEVIGWRQPQGYGSQWESVVKGVTKEIVAAVVARRRKAA